MGARANAAKAEAFWLWFGDTRRLRCPSSNRGGVAAAQFQLARPSVVRRWAIQKYVSRHDANAVRHDAQEYATNRKLICPKLQTRVGVDQARAWWTSPSCRRLAKLRPRHNPNRSWCSRFQPTAYGRACAVASFPNGA